METSNPLGTEKISKLVLKFSIPAIVGMMVNALYNIVDRIYIGNSPDIGQNGLGGITIAFPLMLVALSVGVLFGIGGATLFSIKLGEKKHREAEGILGNAFIMLVVTGLLYSIAGQVFLKPVLTALGASEVTLPYAAEYMQIILLGAVFQITSMGINNFMRADGNPRLAMYTMFMGAGTNIVLDPIFIYGFRMGMRGAAIATVISQFISFVWVVSYFIGKKSSNKLRIKNLKLKPSVVSKIVSLGLPAFFLQFVGSILTSVLNKSLVFYGGDLAVTGMGIINSLQMLMFMPLIGLNQGIQPIISFNFGANNTLRIKQTAILGIKVATAIAMTGFVIIQVFPGLLISMFNRDENLLAFTRFALVTWMFCLPVVGFQIIGANFFQAISKPGTAMFLMLTRQVIFLIPALIVFPLVWGTKGILFAAPFADSLSAILTGVWFYFGLKNLGKHEVKLSLDIPLQQ